MDSVVVPLSIPTRAAVERIKAAGFADDDAGAIRVAVADLASRLGPLSVQARATQLRNHPGPPTPQAGAAAAHADLDPNGQSALEKALEIVRAERCTCRPATGRHHVLWRLLEALDDDSRANWLDVLASARASALKYNERAGWALNVPPASVAYNPAAMSQNWMRAYLCDGAGKFKERYSQTGPSVPTIAFSTGSGIEIRLA